MHFNLQLGMYAYNFRYNGIYVVMCMGSGSPLIPGEAVSSSGHTSNKLIFKLTTLNKQRSQILNYLLNLNKTIYIFAMKPKYASVKLHNVFIETKVQLRQKIRDYCLKNYVCHPYGHKFYLIYSKFTARTIRQILPSTDSVEMI